MSSIYSTVFFPIIPWILQITVAVYAIAVGLYLASIGTPVNQVLRMSEDSNCHCTGSASHYTVILNFIQFLFTFEGFYSEKLAKAQSHSILGRMKLVVFFDVTKMSVNTKFFFFLQNQDGVICDPAIFNQFCRARPSGIFSYSSQSSDVCARAACNFKETQKPPIVPYFQVC